MEQNSNTVIKVLAIIMIAILALNVYRTETNKKELATLSDTVSQIQQRVEPLDSLFVQPSVSVESGSGLIKDLEDRISSLESMVKTLQVTVDRLTKAPSPVSARTASSAGDSSNISGTASSEETKENGRVSVSVRVKVENRYVQGTKPVPKVTIGPVGIVVIDVTINRLGMVGTASINRSSTITDEDVLDLCKEAALKTDFSYNPEAPDKTRGTITYTFTAR